MGALIVFSADKSGVTIREKTPMVVCGNNIFLNCFGLPVEINILILSIAVSAVAASPIKLDTKSGCGRGEI
jgi:hypothetical protein